VRKLLFFLLFNTTLTYSQSLIQTWTDRCTGEVKTFSISMTGYTTVVFYDKVKQFTAADVQSGALRIWMEETYYWWSQLSPCSTNQASSTAAQETAANAASNASNAAANATSGTSTSTGSSNTGTNGTSSGTGSTSSGSSSSSSSSNDSNSSSSGSSENSGSGDNSSSSENNSSGGESSGESNEGGSEESGGSEGEDSSSKEETKEESKEEVKEDKKEEEKKEEKEEEKKEEKEEEKEEEKKEEEKKEEEEKKNKKKSLTPPIVSANLVGMSMIDGTFTQAASFGFSQASLTGAETYSANAMIWSNLRQFSLTLSKSIVNFNYDRDVDIIQMDPFTGKRRKFGSYKDRGSVAFVQSMSIGYMNMFGTSVVVTGYSNVFLGQKDNFWKGFAGGYAINGMGIKPKGGEAVFTTSITLFGTKPFPVGKIVISPMLAYSASPVMYMVEQKKANVTPHGVYIVGSNFDFSITKRFRVNLGITSVGSTQPGIPLSYSLTIGSRFAF
jgi:hypothetical protein